MLLLRGLSFLLCTSVVFPSKTERKNFADAHAAVYDSNTESILPDDSTTPIRLVGGKYGWEGNVQVYHNEEWGTVCENGFGYEETKVVCRMLGYYDTSEQRYFRSNKYQFGTFDIFLDDISCAGNETDINECRTKAWGNTSCTHKEDVGVSCRLPYSGRDYFYPYPTPPPLMTPIRLTNGYAGRVEVYHNSEWGTVCDDGFGFEDAEVVCRMLGYFKTSDLQYHGSAFYGEGSGPVWMHDIKCSGDEGEIAFCSFPGWGKNNCNHSQDVGVSCYKERSTYTTETTTRSRMSIGPNVPLRLVRNQVQVEHNGEWGAVCFNGFGTNEANAICRQLTGKNAISYTVMGSTDTPPTETIWLDDLQCPSDADALSNCTAKPWGDYGCSAYNSIKLFCPDDASSEIDDMSAFHSTRSLDTKDHVSPILDALTALYVAAVVCISIVLVYKRRQKRIISKQIEIKQI